jgi:hypothetical protein
MPGSAILGRRSNQDQGVELVVKWRGSTGHLDIEGGKGGVWSRT